MKIYTYNRVYFDYNGNNINYIDIFRFHLHFLKKYIHQTVFVHSWFNCKLYHNLSDMHDFSIPFLSFKLCICYHEILIFIIYYYYYYYRFVVIHLLDNFIVIIRCFSFIECNITLREQQIKEDKEKFSARFLIFFILISVKVIENISFDLHFFLRTFTKYPLLS